MKTITGLNSRKRDGDGDGTIEKPNQLNAFFNRSNQSEREHIFNIFNISL